MRYCIQKIYWSQWPWPLHSSDLLIKANHQCFRSVGSWRKSITVYMWQKIKTPNYEQITTGVQGEDLRMTLTWTKSLQAKCVDGWRLEDKSHQASTLKLAPWWTIKTMKIFVVSKTEILTLRLFSLQLGLQSIILWLWENFNLLKVPFPLTYQAVTSYAAPTVLKEFQSHFERQTWTSSSPF